MSHATHQLRFYIMFTIHPLRLLYADDDMLIFFNFFFCFVCLDSYKKYHTKLSTDFFFWIWSFSNFSSFGFRIDGTVLFDRFSQLFYFNNTKFFFCFCTVYFSFLVDTKQEIDHFDFLQRLRTKKILTLKIKIATEINWNRCLRSKTVLLLNIASFFQTMQLFLKSFRFAGKSARSLEVWELNPKNDQVIFFQTRRKFF